jgi:SAM-dependent methyltransferase
MIPLVEDPSQNLDPECYLALNRDVERASGDDRVEWAATHFERHGREEGRQQVARSALASIGEARSRKLHELLRRSPSTATRCAQHRISVAGTEMVMLQSLSADHLPIQSDNVSANLYDLPVSEFVLSLPDGLLLDLGAGLRRDYLPNVLNVEIDDFVSTDVVAYGADLPFEDGTFDGAICLAVLEHVRDPFAVATELVRVVRPGGVIIVDWPFLQPEHGYPNHYFNATMEGALSAFRDLPQVATVDAEVPVHMHPIFILPWILDMWLLGLPSEEAAEFASLTVGQLAASSPHDLIFTEPWVTRLAPETQRIIAAGFRLRVTRA